MATLQELYQQQLAKLLAGNPTDKRGIVNPTTGQTEYYGGGTPTAPAPAPAPAGAPTTVAPPVAPVTGGVAAAQDPDQNLNNLISTMLAPEAGGGLAGAQRELRNTPIEDAAAALEVGRMQTAEKARVREAARPSYGFPTKYGVFGASFDQPLTPEQETGITTATKGLASADVERAMTASGGKPDALTAALNQLTPTATTPAPDVSGAQLETTRRMGLLGNLNPTLARELGRLPTAAIEERLQASPLRATAARKRPAPGRRYASY
jgi:hypothetical protein